MRNIFFLFSAFFLLFSNFVYAGSATWSSTPINGNWNTSSNWTPSTVPNGLDDIATFGTSSVTAINVDTIVYLDSIVFNSDASSFTTTLTDGDLFIAGAGIINNSVEQQIFQFSGGLNFALGFYNYSTAGKNTLLMANGGRQGGAIIQFANFSSADHASIDNQGLVTFLEWTTAAEASITTTNGGALIFSGEATAGDSTLITGADGVVEFTEFSTALRARVQLFDNARLFVGLHMGPSLKIGSLEGHGLVALTSEPRFKSNLTVGSNNRTATFSGVIDDRGFGCTVEKTGKGTWFLTNHNDYSGGTTVSKGKLAVNNRAGSATGSGAVQVNAGTLGGKGTVAGPVTVGNAGTTANLAPGGGEPGLLTIQSALSLGANGICHWRVVSSKPKADQVVANGVTIEDGATLETVDRATTTLAPGTVFTVLSNTAASPITGTFSNLPDGGTITVGNNTYQANYEGGDGNDLTLTVL